MKNIEFCILGLGAWGANFRSGADLISLLNGESLEDDGAKGPKPEIIPANERRRAPLPVRLAVETSSQACDNAGLNPAELGCVFVSGLGDTQLTDYMCKVLAGENKALSPTKFHNSVHNAAAGYWTISAGCMQAANSIAGFEQSVPLTLMESLIQADAEQRPILMTFYDAPVSPVLKSILKNEHAFSVSVIIAPTSIKQELTSKLNGELAENTPAHFSATVEPKSCEWPTRNWVEPLNQCYHTNPVARVLPLIELLACPTNQPVSMPVSIDSTLTIQRVDQPA